MELILTSKPRAYSIRVYFYRVRCCPREIEEFDNAEEVSVSSLLADPDTEGETKTNCGNTDAPAMDVVVWWRQKQLRRNTTANSSEQETEAKSCNQKDVICQDGNM